MLSVLSSVSIMHLSGPCKCTESRLIYEMFKNMFKEWLLNLKTKFPKNRRKKYLKVLTFFEHLF